MSLPRALASSSSVIARFSSASRPTAFRGSKALTMAPSRRKQSSLPAGYKEDRSKGAMLRFEDSLPKLPVPTLEETSKRYLKSVHALLSDSEYEDTKKAVEEFVKSGGQGETLQQRLIARAEDPEHKNWIYEWWNSAAYLADTGPVVPYVSYFYSYRDDRRRRNPAKRAAAITTAILEYKKSVDEGALEPWYMRKVPMAMSSIWWMFNACRIPAQPEDYPVKYSYKDHPYIIVVRKNQFFKVYHEVDGKQLNTSELEHQFKRVYELASKSPAVGVLTAERRAEWTKVGLHHPDSYAKCLLTDTIDAPNLLDSSPANKAALEAMEASSFVVCLDDAAPITLEERAHQFWTGDGCNRWFDKPLQFVVNDNGTAGFTGEHSMMDGTATHHLNDYVNEMIFKNKLDFGHSRVRSSLADPSPVRFVLNQQNQKDIASALDFHATTMGQHELRVEAYQGYGKGMIKKFKCSPDGYVQMLIQLAYHKMFGKNRPTYESATTRKFQQGRTEAGRSVSDESVAFCNAMADPEASQEKCAELFHAALKPQGEYIAAAGEGKGVDRHLFGLKKLVKEGEEMPAIFKDPAYSYSSTWYISSSQLSSEYFNGYGWSQVIDDGFGIAYMINENSIQFNVVSKGLGSGRMSFFLNEAAGDIRDMLMPTLGKEKSKL